MVSKKARTSLHTTYIEQQGETASYLHHTESHSPSITLTITIYNRIKSGRLHTKPTVISREQSVVGGWMERTHAFHSTHFYIPVWLSKTNIYTHLFGKQKLKLYTHTQIHCIKIQKRKTAKQTINIIPLLPDPTPPRSHLQYFLGGLGVILSLGFGQAGSHWAPPA